MSKKLTKFTPKLTEEAKLHIVRRSACRIHATEIVKEIKDKFNIDITSTRIGVLVNSKTYYDLFLKLRNEYEKKLINSMDLTDIEIACKNERVKDAEKIRKKLFRLLDVLENTIYKKKFTKYDTIMVREVRGLIDTHLKTLKYAKNEVDDIKEIKDRKQNPSLVQYVQNQQVNLDKGKDAREKEKVQESTEVNIGTVQKDNSSNI